MAPETHDTSENIPQKTVAEVLASLRNEDISIEEKAEIYQSYEKVAPGKMREINAALTLGQFGEIQSFLLARQAEELHNSTEDTRAALDDLETGLPAPNLSLEQIQKMTSSPETVRSNLKTLTAFLSNGKNPLHQNLVEEISKVDTSEAFRSAIQEALDKNIAYVGFRPSSVNSQRRLAGYSMNYYEIEFIMGKNQE